MTAAFVLGRFGAWVSENIASKVTLKKPSRGAEDANYSYTLVHPAVVLQDYDRAGDVVENVPSILLSVSGISNDLTGNVRKYDIDVTVVLWDSGTHNKDKFLPTQDDFTFVQDTKKGYTPGKDVGEGLLNFLDFWDLAFLKVQFSEFCLDTKGWAWAVSDDPEIRESDFRVASTKLTLTEPIFRQTASDSSQTEAEEQEAEAKYNLDAFL